MLSHYAAAQKTSDNDLIQFSGVVITSDSLNPVPFASVIISNTGRGTITDIYGYFSFVAQKGDSVIFSAIGFERAKYTIPTELKHNRYSLIQTLVRDTILLKEQVIYPWPTREQFRQAFLAMEIPDSDYDRAQRNLDPNEMVARMDNMMPSGAETFKYSMQEYQSTIYHAGQATPLQLLNPLAWSQFIQAWKRGDFQSERKRGGQ
jgi:hypothetical protein